MPPALGWCASLAPKRLNRLGGAPYKKQGYKVTPLMLKLLWAVPDCLCWPKDLIRLTVRYNRGAEPWHIKSLDYLFTHKLCCFVNTLLMRSGKFLLHVSYRFFKRDHDTCCHTLEMSCSTPSSLDWCKLEIRCLVSNTNCALLKLSKKHSWTHPRLTEHDYCSK